MFRGAKFGIGPVMHSGRSTRVLMMHVVIALLPVCAGAVWAHGPHAALLLGVAIATALGLDILLDRHNAYDGSAVVIGIIMGLLLPINVPWQIAAMGSAIAVLVGKHAFGGIGKNLFNPAALGLVLMMGFVPAFFLMPLWEVDAVTFATPLAKGPGALPFPSGELLSGGRGVTLAEVVPLSAFAGGLLLIALRSIDWRIPLVYLATISFCALVLPASDAMRGHAPWLEGNPLLHLVNGGALICAFFLITDPVTAPFTRGGRLVFCVLAAVVAMLVRYYTPYPDGVAIGVLLANAPLIDRAMLGNIATGENHPNFLGVRKKTDPNRKPPALPTWK